MAKLLQQIGEYFLGTETRKFYRNYRSFLREYVTDSEDLRKMLTAASKVEEAVDLIVGKGAPNLINLITIGYSLITKNPPYILAAGEGLRLACMAVSGKGKKKLIMKILKLSGDVQVKCSDICDKLEQLGNDLDTEGEGWKNP